MSGFELTQGASDALKVFVTNAIVCGWLSPVDLLLMQHDSAGDMLNDLVDIAWASIHHDSRPAAVHARTHITKARDLHFKAIKAAA